MSEGELETVKALTVKEIKALARPEFEENPERFYPTNVFTDWGFTRAKCPKCGSYYWRHSENATTCGDSSCRGEYAFIGNGIGSPKTKADPESKMSYLDAWNGFVESLSTARIPHTPIPRYPVVARWRADVDFVAAGIYNFQPYCVTGELEPPANPLIDAQFCLRFNDLDNIGVTGRHYSGFNMLGIQVFNSPSKYVYFKEECVEFNLRWLTEELGIPLDEITLIEDVWAGGGNLGPSVEYFVGGLEVGNMVFMQFKTFADGSRTPLQVQVIDVGIGLERIPWLINGSPTSYVDVFPQALKFLQEKTGAAVNEELLTRFAPYSCILDVDEAEDIGGAWDEVAKKTGLTKSELIEGLAETRDLFVVCDHSRSLLVAINDGALPSNVGGASNLRNILRRMFSVIARNGWWEKLGGIDGLMELFDVHRRELAPISGDFKEFSSFKDIISIEHERWLYKDVSSRKKLAQLLKKKKDAKLDIQDWIMAMQSYGLDPEDITEITGQVQPDNLYHRLAEEQEKIVKIAPAVLYDTALIQPTEMAFYDKELEFEFEAQVVDVLINVRPDSDMKGRRNLVILDTTLFYPTGGGQEHDVGFMEIEGVRYEVRNVEKVGKTALHHLYPEPPATITSGITVKGFVDRDRRMQLRSHHTATHLVNAAARRILGPHVWQNGASKTARKAHIDITHYDSLTHEQVVAIEREANRLVLAGIPVRKYFMPKDEAEKRYGFSLYQGGAIPVTSLRIVEVGDIDTEACGGTHVDNTQEIGTIRIIKTKRVSDGIVRITYVSHQRALDFMRKESETIYSLCSEWSCPPEDIVKVGSRFFSGYKKFRERLGKAWTGIAALQLRAASEGLSKRYIVRTESDANVYISTLPDFIKKLDDNGSMFIAVGRNFLLGILSFEGSEEVISGLNEILSKQTKSNSDEQRGDSSEKGNGKVAKEKSPLQMRKNVVAGKGKSKVKTRAIEVKSFRVSSSIEIVRFMVENLRFEEF